MKSSILSALVSGLMFLAFQANAQFDGWQNFTHTAPITSLVDLDQNIALGTGGGIVKINKTTGIKTILTKANDKLNSITITSMVTDKNKQLWLGTSQGFSKERIDTALFQPSIISNGSLASAFVKNVDYVNYVSMRHNGDYILCFPAGLAVFDGKATKFFRFCLGNWKDYSVSPCYGSCDVVDLRQNWVSCAVSDSSNFIWYGTHNGLFKTDLSTWASYDTANSKLPSSNITSIAIVNSKTLWVGTSKGLAQFKSNVWQTISAPTYNLSDSIRSLFVDSQKRLWMVNSLGLLQENSGVWSFIDNRDFAHDIRQIMEDSQGTIWAATDTAVYRVTNYQLQFFASVNNNGIQSNSDYANFVEDSQGAIWCGYTTKQPGDTGIMNFNGQTWSENLIKSMSAAVRNLCIDDKKTVWAATNKGIIHFGENATTIFSNENSALPGNNVSSIVCDKKGALWASIDSSLFSYNDTRWTICLPRQSIAPLQSLFVDNKNNIWAWSTSYGDIEYYDGLQWNKKSFIADSLRNSISGLSQNVKMLSDSLGNLWVWVDTYSGMICGMELSGTFVKKFDGQKWTNYSTDSLHLPCNRIYSLTIDTAGVVWAGSCGGSAAFINNSWKYFENKNLTLPFHKPAPDFIDSKHNYWIAQNGDGIFLKKNTTGILTSKNSIGSVQRNNSISIVNIKSSHYFSIHYRLNAPGEASLEIFNLQGKLLWSVKKNHTSPGLFSCQWDGKTSSGIKINTGVYAVRFQNGYSVSSAKITLAQ